MIRVREALRLTPFQEFELQAGGGGLENEITNVTMLDYETDARDYSAFQRGDFILSSLYFAKNDESLILEAFRALAVKGISGFAIKTVYYFTISEPLRRLAEAANIPIFTFHTTSMEDIIIDVNDLMKERDQQVIYGRLLDQLLASSPTSWTRGCGPFAPPPMPSCAPGLKTILSPPARAPASFRWTSGASTTACSCTVAGCCCCSPARARRRRPPPGWPCAPSCRPCA